MGSFSIFHWVVVIVIIGVIARFLIPLSKKKSSLPPSSTAPTTPRMSVGSTEVRLQQLNDLKEKRLISSLEYERQRAAIIAGI